MENALINLFNLFKNNVYTPIFNALENTKILNSILNLSTTIINNIFKVFNSDLIIDIKIDNDIVASSISLIVLTLTIILFVKMFYSIGSAIPSTFKELTPSEKVSNIIKSRKKKK